MRLLASSLVLFSLLSPCWARRGVNKLVVIEVSQESGAEVVFSKLTSDSVASHKKIHPARKTIEGDELHVKFHDTPEKQKIGHEGDMSHHITHTNARSFEAHGWDPEGEEFKSGTEYHKHASIDAVLPPHVTSVVVEDAHLEVSFVVQIPTIKEINLSGRIHKRSTRAGHVLDQEVLPTLSQSGPTETQQNLIFLSGGYLSSQKAQFEEDVNNVKNILFNTCSDCENAAHLNHSVPYKRYLGGFNVFAVWQSSPQEGASIPTQGVVVNDNLDCSYGTVVERALFCSPAKIQALAETAPSGCVNKQNVVAIVLVNSKLYGGAASYRPTVRVGSFSVSYFDLNDYKSQRGTFASLFFHETGHCYADLMDEYDTQVPESKVIAYTNCHHSDTGEPWTPWLTYLDSKAVRDAIAGESDYYSVATKPIAKCGWTNYFKPSDNCFMEKLTVNGIVPRLCPVCREGSVLMFYKTGIDTTYPKCPLNSEKLFITATGKHSGVYIFVNREFGNYKEAIDGGSVTVTWRCGVSGSMTSAPWENKKVDGHFNSDEPTFVYVTAQWYRDCKGTTSAPITVSVTFTDNTLWVTPQAKSAYETERLSANGNSVPENQKFSQTYSWTVEMVNDIATVNQNGTRNCLDLLPAGTRPSTTIYDQINTMNTAGTVSVDYVSQCLSSDGCTTEYNYTKPFVAVTPSEKNAVSDVEDLMTGPIGIGAGVFVIMFLFSWTCLSIKNSFRRAKSVYSTKFDRWVGWLRKIIMFFGLLFMIVAIVGAVIVLLKYDEVGSFLKLVLLAALLLCIMLFVMAYVGFTAAFFRAKWMLWINGLGLFFTLCLMCYTTYVVIYVGKHIDDTGCTPSPAGSAPVEEDITVVSQCSTEDPDVAICGISGVGCELRELWKTLVENTPDKICAFQDELECSGYTQPCNRQQNTDFCPANCDPDSNIMYGDACKVKLQDDIKKGCEDITPIMIGLTIAMAFAMFNNILLGCLIRSQHKQQRKEQNRCLRNYTDKVRGGGSGAMVMAGTTNRALRLMRALDPEQRELMTRRFEQADRNKDGTLSKRELRNFLRAVLSNKLTDVECAECFAKADTNKDGTISFSEFQELFNPGGRKDVEMAPKEPSNFKDLYQRLEEPGYQADRTRGSSISSVKKSPLAEPLVTS
eukprot:TRINITY_DN2144_c1_g3_i2.p1 TRINITY_DN2144_c1_g3~~TRINITY_DN2144_c1_g3_i2.p1  ORF type:complete len:1149 (+),score=221.61 TRINITY_DN2144_c1_g3_i2:84-3530(+)